MALGYQSVRVSCGSQATSPRSLARLQISVHLGLPLSSTYSKSILDPARPQSALWIGVLVQFDHAACLARKAGCLELVEVHAGRNQSTSFISSIPKHLPRSRFKLLIYEQPHLFS
jgi:hypothetical protein